MAKRRLTLKEKLSRSRRRARDDEASEGVKVDFTAKPTRTSFLARLRNYFFAGILVTAPLTITIRLAWRFIGFIDNKVDEVLPYQWRPDTYLPFTIPGLGLVIVLAVLIMVGAVTKGVAGRFITRLADRLMARLPLVSSLYSWTKQVFETVLSRNKKAFREVVLVEYPIRGTWVVGFITGKTEGEVQAATGETVYNVFVPATPNPTTGFLLFIPEEDMVKLDISVEDAIKLVISGGIVVPERFAQSNWRHSTATAVETEEEISRAEETRHRSLLGRLRNNLLAGMLVTAPLGITLWIAFELVNFADVRIRPLIPFKYNPETYLPFALPGIGLLALLVFLTVVGFLATGYIGRLLVRASEAILDSTPVVRGVYGALKKIFQTVFENQSQAFREAMLIEYPRKGSWAIALKTGEPISDIMAQLGPDGGFNVFLPTTPNPTSGFLLFVSRDAAKPLTMAVEDALKMVISGGIVVPKFEPDGTESTAGPALSPPQES